MFSNIFLSHIGSPWNNGAIVVGRTSPTLSKFDMKDVLEKRKSEEKARKANDLKEKKFKASLKKQKIEDKKLEQMEKMEDELKKLKRQMKAKDDELEDMKTQAERAVKRLKSEKEKSCELQVELEMVSNEVSSLKSTLADLAGAGVGPIKREVKQEGNQEVKREVKREKGVKKEGQDRVAIDLTSCPSSPTALWTMDRMARLASIESSYPRRKGGGRPRDSVPAIRRRCLQDENLFPSELFKSGKPGDKQFNYGLSQLDNRKEVINLMSSSDSEGESNLEKQEERSKKNINEAVSNLTDDMEMQAGSKAEVEVDTMFRLLGGQEEDDSDDQGVIPETPRSYASDDCPPPIDEKGNEIEEASAEGMSAAI